MTGERAVAALHEIGDGLKTVGESFVALTGESARQTVAVRDLGTKIDALQSTADKIKTAIVESKA